MSGRENVFFDSNVLIYHLGGIPKAKPRIESVENGKIKGFINPIVASEVTFFYIKAKTGMKSYEIKRNPSVLASVNLEPVFEPFSVFSILEINPEIVENSKSSIEKYHLLPNDALIVSTCEFYGINKIATFDDDFKRVKTMKIVEKV
ncbi:PIN domain-containing protein [Thermococcus sp. CX2]|uniref:type II toxin-antitoxin system VapC family toxin n=1 Tax=Thermococcus sp. CX2 TaxID=163006 RepID=UPI00143AAA07|nr:type II toxin-antitoxin system VapC family toxin [Thermococcus sp. CX2]NJE85456.1 PIN domain-containing protein [Thermococcus sp. CX2]